MDSSPAGLPIGVFDSGVGGLTVLRALRCALPRESFVYLGDTARLPYGTKSARTVQRYAEQASAVLVRRGIKLLVVACNTASAVAVASLRERFAPVPVVGVIQPGAEAACVASRSGEILVTGTEGTIRGGAYTRAIGDRRPDARVYGQPCPLFVALAEEGWIQGSVPELAAARYLEPVLRRHVMIDTIVLGCTHFPVLEPVVTRVARELAPSLCVVDSASTTASVVREQLRARHSCAPDHARPCLHLLATDDVERFARVGGHFLQTALDPGDIVLVDL